MRFRIRFIVLLLLSLIPLPVQGVQFSLPTENAWVNTPERYLQPTEPGKKNGGFGMVREYGKRFHRGIDIAPVHRNRQQEPTDEIRAVADGILVYKNPYSANSNYGRYVVVQHQVDDVTVCSVYAHLSKISPELKIGQEVSRGTVLGIMGRTSNCYEIPKSQAHLHFEFALMLGTKDSFQDWYHRQQFGSPNTHGRWNGMNWTSMDPFPILQKAQISSLREEIQSQPTAYITRVYRDEIPQFLRENPGLCAESIEVLEKRKAEKKLGGYDIEWTWCGVPKRWIPHGFRKVHDTVLLSYDEGSLREMLNLGTLKKNKKNDIEMGSRTQGMLAKMFFLQ